MVYIKKTLEVLMITLKHHLMIHAKSAIYSALLSNHYIIAWSLMGIRKSMCTNVWNDNDFCVAAGYIVEPLVWCVMLEDSCVDMHIYVCVRWSERTGVCVLDAYRDFISIMVGAAALVPPRCLCQHVREPGRVPQRHVSLSIHTNVQRTRCGGMFQRRYRTSVDGIHVNIQQLCLCALRAFWTSYMQVRVPEINYFWSQVNVKVSESSRCCHVPFELRTICSWLMCGVGLGTVDRSNMAGRVVRRPIARVFMRCMFASTPHHHTRLSNATETVRCIDGDGCADSLISALDMHAHYTRWMQIGQPLHTYQTGEQAAHL